MPAEVKQVSLPVFFLSSHIFISSLLDPSILSGRLCLCFVGSILFECSDNVYPLHGCCIDVLRRNDAHACLRVICAYVESRRTCVCVCIW